MILGSVLQHARQRAGFSARHLSDLAGMSASYVTKVEHGEIEPSLKNFARLCRALNLNQTEVYFCVMTSIMEAVDDQ